MITPKDLDNKLKRIRIVLNWCLKNPIGEVVPQLEGEDHVSRADMFKTIKDVNHLRGKRCVSMGTVGITMYEGKSDEVQEELDQEEKVSIAEIFKEAEKIVDSTEDSEFKSTFGFRLDSGALITPEISIFNGGELNLNIGTQSANAWDVSSVRVFARIQDSNGVIALLLLKDALEQALESDNNTVYLLYLDYVPYARQDRVCNEGEALSVRVMADLINSMGFDQVTISDPHSDVTPALIRSCEVTTVTDILYTFKEVMDRILAGELDAVVSPDGGSIKKVEEVGKELDIGVVYGHKKRDISTGKLSGFSCEHEVTDMNLLIVDDICDGGGTFIGLGKLLKEKGCKSLSLYVTHGIFSKGLDDLLEIFDYIYTTDSFESGIRHPRLVIKRLFGK